MASGASRLTLAQAKLKNSSQAEINAAFKDENNTAKGVKKLPLKASASSHNHSR